MYRNQWNKLSLVQIIILACSAPIYCFDQWRPFGRPGRPYGKYFNESWFEIHKVSIRKMLLEIPSAKWWSFCIGLNIVLQYCLHITGIQNVLTIHTFHTPQPTPLSVEHWQILYIYFIYFKYIFSDLNRFCTNKNILFAKMFRYHTRLYCRRNILDYIYVFMRLSRQSNQNKYQGL